MKPELKHKFKLRLKPARRRIIDTKVYKCFYCFVLGASLLVSFLCLADYLIYKISGFHYILVGSNVSTGAQSLDEISEIMDRSAQYKRWYTPIIENGIIVLLILDIFLLISQITKMFRWHHIVLFLCLLSFFITGR